MDEVWDELNNLFDRINKEKNRRKYSKGFEDNIRRIIADINLLSDITENKLKSLSKDKIPVTLELDWVDPGDIQMLVDSGYDSFEIREHIKDYEYDDEDYKRVFRQLKNVINECAMVVRLTLKELKLIKSNKQVIETGKNQEKTDNQNESGKLTKKQEKSNKDNRDGMTIFISHISEESEYASIIKRYLEDNFLKKLNIFVFTDVESIEPGSQWFNRIQKGIQKSEIMLTLCSSVSVRRPWINFEAGAFWFKKMMQREFLIPVILPGYSKKELPTPLSFLQAIEIDNEKELKNLFSQIAKIIKVDVPEIDYSKLIEKITTIKVEYKSKESKKTQDISLVNDRLVGINVEEVKDVYNKLHASILLGNVRQATYKNRIQSIEKLADNERWGEIKVILEQTIKLSSSTERKELNKCLGKDIVEKYIQDYIEREKKQV